MRFVSAHLTRRLFHQQHSYFSSCCSEPSKDSQLCPVKPITIALYATTFLQLSIVINTGSSSPPKPHYAQSPVERVNLPRQNVAQRYRRRIETKVSIAKASCSARTTMKIPPYLRSILARVLGRSFDPTTHPAKPCPQLCDIIEAIPSVGFANS